MKELKQAYNRREMLRFLGLGSAAIFLGYDPLRATSISPRLFSPTHWRQICPPV